MGKLKVDYKRIVALYASFVNESSSGRNFVDSYPKCRYHPAVMPLLSRAPQMTLFAGFFVFSFTLVLSVTSGVGIAQPINLVFIVLLALSVLGMFLAQNPNNENAALMMWFAAGVWGAAAYLNFQTMGLFHLIVALLAAGSAFLIERESRVFSFTGPALLIGTGLALAILSVLLAR